MLRTGIRSAVVAAVDLVLYVVFCSISPIRGAYTPPYLGEDETHINTPFELAVHKLRGRAHVLEETLAPLVTSEKDAETLHWLATSIDSGLLDDDEGPVCQGCNLVFGVLRNVTRYPWFVLRSPLIVACNLLLNGTDPSFNPGEVMCNGIIDLQGKAIYDILNDERGTSAKFCEVLNACIPPREPARKHGDVMRSGDVMAAFRKRGPPQARRHERAANQIRIVQLADIHIEPDYAVGSKTDCGLPVCCQDGLYGTGSAAYWGDYRCNIPLHTMRLFLRKTKELNPDFIVFSGDTPPHTMWDETRESQLDCTRTLVDAIEEDLAGVPTYPNIGNHEMFPTNLYNTETLDTVIMNEEFATVWTTSAGFTSEQRDTMRAAGYYSILAKPGLRLISLNTNYWYSFNFYNVFNEDIDAYKNMQTFLEDELENARTNEEKVILVNHHPTSNGDIVVKQARWLTDLTNAYRDVIVSQMCGHTHNDEFRLIRDIESEEPSGVMYVAPSVTTNTLKNPSLRVYIHDASTFELLDYEQYNMDLLQAVANGSEPEIQLLYSAKQEFGLADMSPQSWADFHGRMTDNTQVLQQYLRHYNTGTVDDPLDGCDAACQWRYLCKFGSGTYDRNVECLRYGPPDPPQPTLSSASINTVSHALIASLILLLLGQF